MEPIAETTAERRSVVRRRVLKGATLTFNRGYGAMECVVRNLGDNGALLRFGDAAGVPAWFDLKISDERQPRPAQVRWRTATDVGVSFLTEG